MFKLVVKCKSLMNKHLIVQTNHLKQEYDQNIFMTMQIIILIESHEKATILQKNKFSNACSWLNN